MIPKILQKLSFLLIAFYGFLVFLFKPWEGLGVGVSLKDGILAGMVALTLGGLIASCVGMILRKRDAKKWFLTFNGVYLLFGCYLTHFNWTFWIFREPTLADRLLASAPSFLLGVLLPLGLILLSLRSGNEKT